MKTTKALFEILTITAALAVQVQAQSFLTNGLVAYYPFNGIANDASGNGNNGTTNNVAFVPDLYNNPNAAIQFYGDTSSYVDVTPISSLNFTNEITVSLWCAVDGPGTQTPRLVSILNPVTSGGGEIAWRNGPPRQFVFDYGSGSPTWSGNYTNGQWIHLVGVGTGTSAMLYVNGLLVSTATGFVVGNIGQITLMNIGRMAYPGYDAFDGRMDEVRIYNRALSSNEVAQLHGYESQATNPPSITGQPQSVVVNAHDTASFSVTATGTMPLNYQWSLNGTNILGATSSSLTITNVRQRDLGSYSVVVTNAFGSVASSNAMLSMYPFLAGPFAGAITYWGKDATLSVQAWGTGPLSYQWFENGVAIQDATNQTFTLTSIQFTNAGLYSVVVSSPLGSVTNTPAQVIVNPAEVSLGFCPALTFGGVVGYSYIIQSSTDLTDTNAWVTLTNLTLTQPVQLWVDTNANAWSPYNSKYFYRVLPGQ